ncbi:MAG: ribose 5-phosphate isomerase A [Candidatus Nanopelagicales bacterium]
MSLDDEKRVAAEAAADLIEDGMSVGLGTGSTVAHLLAAVARRGRDIRCVSTSPRTEEAARGLGIRTESFDDVTALDLAIDGADQVSPDWWLVKGGGAAHTREKLVAAAAERFVVIVDSTKLVDRITAPVPLELLAFGLGSTLARLGDAALRDVPRTPDGGVIADYTGPVADPAALANLLSATAGVVDHGLFPPTMVAAIVVGEGDEARWLERLPG